MSENVIVWLKSFKIKKLVKWSPNCLHYQASFSRLNDNGVLGTPELSAGDDHALQL